MRVGFIGAGGASRSHMENVRKAEGFEVAAICDIDGARAKQAAQRYGGTAYARYDEMYEKEQLDAVVISIPPHVHGEPELMAIERGCHLFIEKPVGLDLDTCKKIRDAAKGKVVTSVGYHWRYTKATEQARALLEGKPLALAAGYWTGGIYGPMWWRTRSQSGGQLVEQTTHIVDLARHLVGDVARVRAVSRRGLQTDVPGYDIDDASMAQLEFKNGVIGTIVSACTLNFGYRIQLDLVGRDFVIEVGGNKVTHMTAGVTNTWEYRESPYDAEMAAFLKAVKTKDTSGIRSAYGDALKTLAVSLAANKSMETGRAVKPGA